MKTSQSILFLILLTASLLITNACKESNASSEDSEDETVKIPVEVSHVNRGDISAYYSNTATLEAEQEAIIVSKVRGIINNIYAEEGDVVRAGQVLAKLEEDQYGIEVARAKATLDRLYNEYMRNKELFDRNLISAEAFQNAQYEYEAQKAAYELAELNLENTSIKSPIDGVISERFVKKGNMIGTDQEMFRVTDFNPLQAILYVPEHELSKIRKNQLAQLRVDAFPDRLFEGRIERISPVVDPQTGTFKVTVFVNQEQDLLRPGMFGRIKIVYDTRENTRMIPKSAVISEDFAESVYVIKDSLAFKKQIRTGYANGLNVEVLDGLEDGEVVVTIGQGSLQDSSRVSIISSL